MKPPVGAQILLDDIDIPSWRKISIHEMRRIQ